MSLIYRYFLGKGGYKQAMPNSKSATPNLTALLIGGLPRGGTTAITDIVNECPDAAIMAEYRLVDLIQHMMPVLDYEGIIDNLNGTLLAQDVEPVGKAPLVPDGADLDLKDPGEQPSKLKHYQTASTPNVTKTIRYPTTERFPSIVAQVVKASLDKPSARVIGSKTPGSMLKDGGEAIAGLFPALRYVAMLRSPLGQINSSMNRRNRFLLGVDYWHIGDVDEAIEQYLDVIRGLIVLKQLEGDRLLFVKYEDLLGDTRRIFDLVFSHIGSDWRPKQNLALAERGTIDVLTRDEKKKIQAVFGALLDQWDAAVLTGGGEVDLSIFNNLLPQVPNGAFAIGGPKKPSFLIDGWSDIEEDGIWTDSRRATMLFGPTNSSVCMLKIEMMPYLASGLPVQLEVLLNGAKIGKTLLCGGAGGITPASDSVTILSDWLQKHELWIGPMNFKSDDSNLLEFHLNGITSPRSIGRGDDDRLLGIRLSAVHFIPID